MLKIFEYNDIFEKNEFKKSEDPLINEFQENIKDGFINSEIGGYIWDEYGCETPYTVIGINDYNKFYIFDFLSEKYPEYGFLDSLDNGLRLFGEFFCISRKPTIIDI